MTNVVLVPTILTFGGIFFQRFDEKTNLGFGSKRLFPNAKLEFPKGPGFVEFEHGAREIGGDAPPPP